MHFVSQVADVFGNEPNSRETFANPGFCICNFNGCVIACFMNNQISSCTEE